MPRIFALLTSSVMPRAAFLEIRSGEIPATLGENLLNVQDDEYGFSRRGAAVKTWLDRTHPFFVCILCFFEFAFDVVLRRVGGRRG